jgi:hypothetical protein
MSQPIKIELSVLIKYKAASTSSDIFLISKFSLFLPLFRVKNHDFTPKNHIFSNFRGARAPGAPPPGSAPGKYQHVLFTIMINPPVSVESNNIYIVYHIYKKYSFIKKNTSSQFKMISMEIEQKSQKDYKTSDMMTQISLVFN